MNILEHLITAPADNKTYRVMVDVPQKEGHHLTGTKGASGDVTDGYASMVAHGVTCGAERGGKLGALDVSPTSGCEDGTERRGSPGAVGAQVLDLLEE